MTPATTARADALAQSLAGVSDPKLRVEFLRHQLAELDGLDVAELVLIASGRSATRKTPHPELLLCMSIALDTPELADVRQSAIRVAMARGLDDVLQLLGRPEDDPDVERKLPVPDHGVGRPLTLGERKALARRGDRNLIARVVRDPHPDVIRILLDNRSVTEDDVVRLCARRPVAPEALREVFRSLRWVVRYRVRRALVLNPNTPLGVGLALAPHLTAQDARLVVSSSRLHRAVRDACDRSARGSTVH